jgi:hypothetical protein
MITRPPPRVNPRDTRFREVHGSPAAGPAGGILRRPRRSAEEVRVERRLSLAPARPHRPLLGRRFPTSEQIAPHRPPDTYHQVFMLQLLMRFMAAGTDLPLSTAHGVAMFVAAGSQPGLTGGRPVYGISLDLNLVVALWMAGAVLLVPLVGLSVRFGLVPLLDAVTRLRSVRATGETDPQVQERLARLETRLARACAELAELSSREPSLR